MKSGDISEQGLRIAIGFPSAVMLVIGGIVGVGIFANPAIVAHRLHDPGLVLAAWVAGGVIAMLGAFVYAELAARIPATGGEYVYLRDTYGPLAGFLFGWTTLFVVQAGGMAAVSIVFAKNLNVLAGGVFSEPAIVVSVMAGLAAINCIGVKSGNGLQSLLGLLRVAAIAALVIAGLMLTPHVPPHVVAAKGSGAPFSVGTATAKPANTRKRTAPAGLINLICECLYSYASTVSLRGVLDGIVFGWTKPGRSVEEL